MRCSACAKAGVDLYFCSAEHQKLVRPSATALYRVLGLFDADRWGSCARCPDPLSPNKSSECFIWKWASLGGFTRLLLKRAF